jgi:hypothetical protein
MDNTTASAASASPSIPKFDLGVLKHVARVPSQVTVNHPTPKTLEDLNAELNSIDMGHMEFVKYEGKEDPHLEAFLAENGGGSDSGS